MSVEGVGGEVEEEGDVEDLMVTLVDPSTPIKEGEREDRDVRCTVLLPEMGIFEVNFCPLFLCVYRYTEEEGASEA